MNEISDGNHEAKEMRCFGCGSVLGFGCALYLCLAFLAGIIIAIISYTQH